jgi:hypothetical protein
MGCIKKALAFAPPIAAALNPGGSSPCIAIERHGAPALRVMRLQVYREIDKSRR